MNDDFQMRETDYVVRHTKSMPPPLPTIPPTLKHYRFTITQYISNLNESKMIKLEMMIWVLE